MSDQIGLSVEYKGPIQYLKNTEFRAIQLFGSEIKTYAKLGRSKLRWYLPDQSIYVDRRFISELEAQNLMFAMKTIKKTVYREKKLLLYKIYSKHMEFEPGHSYVLKITHLTGFYFWAEKADVTYPQIINTGVQEIKKRAILSSTPDLVMKIFLKCLEYLHLLLQFDPEKKQEKTLTARATVYRLGSILRKRELSRVDI